MANKTDQKPSAYLVTDGKIYCDRVHMSLGFAEKSVADREDGSRIVPLYRSPPASASVDEFKARLLDTLTKDHVNSVFESQKTYTLDLMRAIERGEFDSPTS